MRPDSCLEQPDIDKEQISSRAQKPYKCCRYYQYGMIKKSMNSLLLSIFLLEYQSSSRYHKEFLTNLIIIMIMIIIMIITTTSTTATVAIATTTTTKTRITTKTTTTITTTTTTTTNTTTTTTYYIYIAWKSITTYVFLT